MKAIKLKAATAALQEKKLSEEQMNDLLGGAKCPYCEGDFDPGGVYSLSWYTCTGVTTENYTLVTDDIEATSKEEAELNFSQGGKITGIVCEPRAGYYNTAPGF